MFQHLRTTLAPPISGKWRQKSRRICSAWKTRSRNWWTTPRNPPTNWQIAWKASTLRSCPYSATCQTWDGHSGGWKQVSCKQLSGVLFQRSYIHEQVKNKCPCTSVLLVLLSMKLRKTQQFFASISYFWFSRWWRLQQGKPHRKACEGHQKSLSTKSNRDHSTQASPFVLFDNTDTVVCCLILHISRFETKIVSTNKIQKENFSANLRVWVSRFRFSTITSNPSLFNSHAQKRSSFLGGKRKIKWLNVVTVWNSRW